jgi:hypothetical protein
MTILEKTMKEETDIVVEESGGVLFRVVLSLVLFL